MKGKATVASADPANAPELAKALDVLAEVFTNMRDEVQEKALNPNIVGANAMGPGELFFQTSDRMGITKSGLGCDVQISRMSKTPRRSDQSFWDALDAFQELCKEKIEQYLAHMAFIGAHIRHLFAADTANAELQLALFHLGHEHAHNIDSGIHRIENILAQAEAAGTPVEPVMDVSHVASSVLHMASLPLDANVQFMTVMATTMPYIGRG